MSAPRLPPWVEALLLGALALGVFHAAAAWGSAGFWTTPRWDEGYYASIAAAGYTWTPADHLRESNVVFSPGYPALLRGLSWLTGLPVAPARLVLSGLLFLVSAVLAHALFATVLADRAQQRRALLAFTLAPGAFFAMVGYAEALYLPLTLAFFLALRRQRRLLACACAAAALSVRAPAIVLPLTLAVLTVLDAIACRSPRDAGRMLGRLCCLELPICALGVAATFLVLRWQVGDGFAFLDAYVAWNRVEPATASLLPDVRPSAILPEVGRTPTLWVALAGFYLTPLLLLGARRHLPFVFFAYGAVSWVFFLANENPYRLPFGNWIRWLSMVFPLAVAWVALTAAGRAGRWRVFWVGLAAQLAVFAWLAHRFASGAWVS